MKKKNIWLFFLCSALLCSSLYLGVKAMAAAFDREAEMKEVNNLAWTLHPCDIGNDFTYIAYDRQHQVFLADGVLDGTGGSEDGRPITETGDAMDNLEKYPNLRNLYFKVSRRREDGRKLFGCLRYDGSVAIPFDYDGLEGFEGDYCIAWKTSKLMIINKYNDIIYTVPDSSSLKWLANNIFSVENQGERKVFRIIKSKAVPVKANQSVESRRTTDEYAVFRDRIQIFMRDEKYGLKDEAGKIFAGPVFDSLQFAGDRYLIAVYRGRYGIADVKTLDKS